MCFCSLKSGGGGATNEILIVQSLSLLTLLDSCVSRKEDEMVLSCELLVFTRTQTRRLSFFSINDFYVYVLHICIFLTKRIRVSYSYRAFYTSHRGERKRAESLLFLFLSSFRMSRVSAIAVHGEHVLCTRTNARVFCPTWLLLL